LEFGAVAVNNLEVIGEPEQLTNTRSGVRYINVKIRDLSTVHGITITEQLTNAHQVQKLEIRDTSTIPGITITPVHVTQ
jgi:hypothetical protein